VSAENRPVGRCTIGQHLRDRINALISVRTYDSPLSGFCLSPGIQGAPVGRPELLFHSAPMTNRFHTILYVLAGIAALSFIIGFLIVLANR